MTGTTSVPQPTFGPTGFIIPAESDILAGVQADQNAAFGGNVNPALNTPQGQLASSTTAIIGDTNDQFLFLTNQFDPALNSGRWQDGIAYIYFLTRLPAQSTSVTCTCTGLAGVVIPAGAIAAATDGNTYTATATGTIGAGGTVSIVFQCITTGPIACPTGSLNAIAQAIPGWDTITNPADGVIGRNVETAQAFELRRGQSVAQNALGTLPAIRGAVLSVPGVTDAYVYDNSTSAPVTILGQTIAANSLYVAVAGGASGDIGNAIWRKKSPGCAYTGNTNVTVYDTNSGYGVPYPSYTVTYEAPAALEIIFAVQIANSSSVPANAAALIQGVIINAFAGADGGSRATIGSLIFASRFYAGIAGLGAWAQIVSLLLGSTNSAAATFTGAITGTALTVSGVTGTVAIGQTVQGASVLDGTTIVSGSGSSWVLSQANPTIGAETMYGVVASLNDIQVKINQIPTVSAANIAVSLV